MKTYAYGFPRIGAQREYKRTIERCWNEDFSSQACDELVKNLRKLQDEMITMYDSQVDEFPSGEMTGYDPMLDVAIMVGRYNPSDWRDYYELCRGATALEMTKWFNTNYHYLVPEFGNCSPASLKFNDRWIKLFDRAERADMPRAMIGPYTFLRLSKEIPSSMFGDFLEAVTHIYSQLLTQKSKIWLFEPAFVLDEVVAHRSKILKAYATLGETGADISLFTYYDNVDFLQVLYDMPVSAIGIDCIHSSEAIEQIETLGFPQDKTLIAGLVDGRNVWRTDVAKTCAILRRLSRVTNNIAISNAAPLFHLPYTIEGEQFDAQLMQRIAFAKEKLEDLALIKAQMSQSEASASSASSDADAAHTAVTNTKVQQRIAALTESDFVRATPYAERREAQQKRFSLPIFPTTTIGSFPQTPEVRKKRAQFRKGEIDEATYRSFVDHTIADTIKRQEQLDLDVLVHGESERTDMVEFFAEKMDGIAMTKNGWIISYGTRGYRPPIIYGDVSRPAPMSIREISYAQSLTTRPVKGMLTGPVTIIAWSFVRSDMPIDTIAYQISLALQDEVADYERAGIGIVQIDEPAFREMAPNKRRRWPDYFKWAANAFRLCTAAAKADTQIHSHMCYSEFNEILTQISEMDFDVISIEATRSRGEVVEYFANANFDRQIGLGVFDIHSPAIPSETEIKDVIDRAISVIPPHNFWINPDCGLKTRKWNEVMQSLGVMVAQAIRHRNTHTEKK